MVIINENMTTLPATKKCSDFFLDMCTVNVGPQLVKVSKRKFALGTRYGVLAVAFNVLLQVVNPGKSLLAHWTREMVLFGQVRCLVAFKSVFSLEDFATVTLEDLDAKVDVVVALQ